MALPKEASSHHTVWVARPGAAPAVARYASANDRLYCFADDGLTAVHDGDRVRASIHRIACGPPLVEFPATAHRVDGASVDREAMLELLEHVPLGRTREEVDQSLERHRRRPVVELVP